MSDSPRNLYWRPWDDAGLEHLNLSVTDEGAKALGLILRMLDGGHYRIRYELEADAAWRVRRLSFAVMESDSGTAERLLLESDGTQAHAIFREVDAEKKRTRVEGRYYGRFLDHYACDCAAYDLARVLGLDTVPPTTIRRIGSSEGSVQVWVENAGSTTAPGFRPKSPIGWVKQQWDMHLFDNLIFNADRTAQNILAGENGELWLIDHGRAFQPKAELLSPENVKKINRRIWDRLQALSDDELKDVVRDHLDTEQLHCLVKRRELLVELVQGLVAEKGEDKVFY